MNSSRIRVFCALAVATAMIWSIGCGGKDEVTPSGGRVNLGTKSNGNDDKGGDNGGESIGPVGEGWGSFKGRFVVDGVVPQPDLLNVTADKPVCGKFKLVDESVVVNEKDKGLANVAVYLYVKRGDKPPTPHESYKDVMEQTVVLENKNCRFEPRIRLLLTTQTLAIKNSDPVSHNTNITLFNDLLPVGATIERTITDVQTRPLPTSCNIHPWMKAYTIVKNSPYFKVSDASGNFEIKDVPSGNWRFVAWHETGYVRDVTVEGEKATWDKGRFDVTITDKETLDLGDIQIAADSLK